MSSTVHPLSWHAYSDVLNVETLPMGLVHVVLQGGEEERSGEEKGMEWGRRKGMEWSGEEKSGPSNGHTSRNPSSIMAFDKGNKRERDNKSCRCVYCTQVFKY